MCRVRPSLLRGACSRCRVICRLWSVRSRLPATALLSLALSVGCGKGEHSVAPTPIGDYLLKVTQSASCQNWPAAFPHDSMWVPMRLNDFFTTAEVVVFDSANPQTGMTTPRVRLTASQRGSIVVGDVGGGYPGLPPEGNYLFQFGGPFEGSGSLAERRFTGRFGSEIRLRRQGLVAMCNANDHSFTFAPSTPRRGPT